MFSCTKHIQIDTSETNKFKRKCEKKKKSESFTLLCQQHWKSALVLKVNNARSHQDV